MINLTREEAQIPLVEQLESVPQDARLCIDDADGMGTHYFPIGNMCHEAAKAIRAKLSEPEPAPTNNGRYLTGYKAQPEPDPVAWFMENTFMDGTPSFIQVCETDPEFYTPLYRAPQPELKEDVYCQACEGNHCTAKTGCVAISNPPQRKWVGLTAQDLADVGAENIIGAIWADAKLKEKNAPYL